MVLKEKIIQLLLVLSVVVVLVYAGTFVLMLFVMNSQNAQSFAMVLAYGLIPTFYAFANVFLTVEEWWNSLESA